MTGSFALRLAVAGVLYAGLAAIVLSVDSSTEVAVVTAGVLVLFALATAVLGEKWILRLAPVPWLVVGLWVAMLTKSPLECETCDSGVVGALFYVAFLVFLGVLVAALGAAVRRAARLLRRGKRHEPAGGST